MFLSLQGQAIIEQLRLGYETYLVSRFWEKNKNLHAYNAFHNRGMHSYSQLESPIM